MRFSFQNYTRERRARSGMPVPVKKLAGEAIRKAIRRSGPRADALARVRISLQPDVLVRSRISGQDLLRMLRQEKYAEALAALRAGVAGLDHGGWKDILEVAAFAAP